MSSSDTIRVGLVGAAGRGGSFRAAMVANGARIQAVCDTNQERLAQAAKTLGAEEQYPSYEDMLDRGHLDAVVLGTPMDLHVPQSIAALSRDLHVLSEVPASVSIDESKELVSAARRSRGVYMMAENYTYIRSNVLVRELVRRGLFGTPYYGEGEYLHELKGLNEITTWRRKWQTGIEGITYGTHSLGPLLQWMPGDRVERVCCEGSGHHYLDPRGEQYHQESVVMLCKMRSGGLVKIRVDMLSDRPHAMTNYQLQGTDGAYESARGGPGDTDKIWLRSLSDEIVWHDLSAAEEYLPEDWRSASELARKSGHGGGDYFEVLDFLRAIRGEAPCPVGIDEAMDMTLPGLISQQSILQGGRWIWVPDSRDWKDDVPQGQLQMTWPERLLDHPPAVNLAEGYELRQYRGSDKEAYLALMHKAGFTFWDENQINRVRPTVLPAGHFVIEHRATGALVATALAHHMPTARHPEGGELGWVAADPEHKGKGLGVAVCSAAVDRLLRAGYRRIFLSTDDHRLPALAIYLRMGFEPFYATDDAKARWTKVKAELGLGA
jgi:predicted dehydrogenase/GNAT superfamily N-acetyltransferase